MPDLTQFMALTTQTIAVGYEGREQALARVVLVNSDSEIVLDAYVKPTERVFSLRSFDGNLLEQKARNGR